MSALLVDTSIWIDFFRGETIAVLEEALQEARVLLSPIVLAEIISGTTRERERGALADFLEDLPLHPTDRMHWIAVGKLRSTLKQVGLSVSTPDAHIAQCAIEGNALLFTWDKIFKKIAEHTPLKLLHS